LTGDLEERSARPDEALVDAFCRISFMGSPSDRGLLVSQLAHAVEGLPDLAAHTRMRSHALEIVSACLRHPGGLQGLVSVVKIMAPGEWATIEFERLVISLSVLDLVSVAARREIHELLAAAPPLDVTALWFAAAGDAAPLPHAPPPTLVDAFDHLATVNTRWDGVPPALALVEYLAGLNSLAVAAELSRWNDRQAAALGVGVQLARLRQRIADEGAVGLTPPCLVIQIDGPRDTDLYLISHWIQRRPGTWRPERGGDQEVSLADLERVMGRLLDEAEHAWSRLPAGKVKVEFVLPMDLLNMAVDWWHQDAGSPHAVPLCVEYPVVLRSLDRMRATNSHRLWRNRWERLRDVPLHAKWAPEGQLSEELTRWNTALRADEAFTAVVLTAPPTERSPAGREALRMALRAGVPVLLWDRRDQPGADFPETAGKLLADGASTEIPERVMRVRATSAQSHGGGHVGRHLAVLFDDPTRLVGVGELRLEQRPGNLENGGNSP
jgi:hypothetical protein